MTLDKPNLDSTSLKWIIEIECSVFWTCSLIGLYVELSLTVVRLSLAPKIDWIPQLELLVFPGQLWVIIKYKYVQSDDF